MICLIIYARYCPSSSNTAMSKETKQIATTRKEAVGCVDFDKSFALLQVDFSELHMHVSR